MERFISYEPSTDDIYSYDMQITTDETHMYYKINLGVLSEGQRMHLSQLYGISLNILESEPSLTLVRITDI